MTDQVRYKLVLGKYRVQKVGRLVVGFEIVIELGEAIKLTCTIPSTADVREGDLLTLYTEVLANANSGQPSIQ